MFKKKHGYTYPVEIKVSSWNNNKKKHLKFVSSYSTNFITELPKPLDSIVFGGLTQLSQNGLSKYLHYIKSFLMMRFRVIFKK